MLDQLERTKELYAKNSERFDDINLLSNYEVIESKLMSNVDEVKSAKTSLFLGAIPGG
ncbi:MAG: hypothetical protein R3C11_21165 [Planctomycetaceae bacterium]